MSARFPGWCPPDGRSGTGQPRQLGTGGNEKTQVAAKGLGRAALDEMGIDKREGIDVQRGTVQNKIYAAPWLALGANLLFPVCFVLGGLFGYSFALRGEAVFVTLCAAACVCLAAVFCGLGAQPLPSHARKAAWLLFPAAVLDTLLLWLFSSWEFAPAVTLVCCAGAAACWVKAVRTLAGKAVCALVCSLFLAGFVPLVAVAIAFGGMGQNTVVRTLPSPQGMFVARIVDSDQGALGGDTLVEVQRSGSPVDVGIGVFNPAWVRVYAGEWGEAQTMQLVWADEQTLVIDGQAYPMGEGPRG